MASMASMAFWPDVYRSSGTFSPTVWPAEQEGVARGSSWPVLPSSCTAPFPLRYPMDLRTSGKDLVPNHLTMSLYGLHV